jgi:hypothetical protein
MQLCFLINNNSIFYQAEIVKILDFCAAILNLPSWKLEGYNNGKFAKSSLIFPQIDT